MELRPSSVTQFYTEQGGWTDLNGPNLDPGFDLPCATFADSVTGELIGVMLLGAPVLEGEEGQLGTLIYNLASDTWTQGPIFENEVTVCAKITQSEKKFMFLVTWQLFQFCESLVLISCFNTFSGFGPPLLCLWIILFLSLDTLKRTILHPKFMMKSIDTIFKPTAL